jgi:hypothetical protein
MTKRTIFAAVALASGIFVLGQGGADARIVCDGNYQVVDGIPVSTPLCRDRMLVHVARSRGWHVSEYDIRYSDSIKGAVCRAIGFDNRVREVCGPYSSDGGDSGRFPH